MGDVVSCWSCGDALGLVPGEPVSRREVCPRCGADVRSCRGCTFYDASSADGCREPAAERVADKEQANFCGWYQLAVRSGGGGAGATDPAAEAKRRLEALFGRKP